MIKNWLEEYGVLVTEQEDMLSFGLDGKKYSIEKRKVENADIHNGIVIFGEILEALEKKE